MEKATLRGWHVLVIALVSAAGAVFGLIIGPSLDAAAFQVVGWRLADGAALYQGIWDHKPPGTYLIPSLSELFNGDTGLRWAAISLLSAWTVLLTALLSAEVVLRLGRVAAAFGAALLIALASSQYLLSLGGGLAEQPATLLALCSVVLVLGGAAVWRWLLAGALVAAGVLISIQAAPAGAALLLIAVERRRTSVVALAIGGLAVLAAAGAVLAWAGVLPDAVDAILTYNAAYRAAAATSPASLRVVPWVTLSLIPLLALAAAGWLALRRWPAARPFANPCLAWLGAGLLLLVVQGRFYAHYVVPLIVPLGVLAGVGLADVLSLTRRRAGLGIAAGVAGTLLVAVAVLAGVAGGLQEVRTWSRANRDVHAVAAYIQQYAQRSATIWVWGNQPLIYRASERRPAIRYPYLFPLTTPGYATPQLIDELRAELEASPPALIIDAGSLGPGEPGTPPLLIPRPVAAEGRDLDILDPLRDFVRQRYRLVAIVGGWPVYMLADDR
jgi:hypothetical protein